MSLSTIKFFIIFFIIYTFIISLNSAFLPKSMKNYIMGLEGEVNFEKLLNTGSIVSKIKINV